MPTGGGECREQARTHRTPFLRLLLGLLPRGEAVNPQKENSPAFDRQNQILQVFESALVLTLPPEGLHGHMHYV